MNHKINREPNLRSIAVFEDHVVHDSESTSTTLEDYVAHVNTNGEYPSYISLQKSDELGERLKVIGLRADMNNSGMLGKASFKEFLLFGLRYITGAHDVHNQIDTYEFDTPKYGTYSAYIESRDIVSSTEHKRLFVVVISNGGYPRILQKTVAESMMNNIFMNLNQSQKLVDKHIDMLLKKFYTVKNAARLGGFKGEIENDKPNNQNIKKLVIRIEDVDTMVKKSKDLSDKSKDTYQRGRRHNIITCSIL